MTRYLKKLHISLSAGLGWRFAPTTNYIKKPCIAIRRFLFLLLVFLLFGVLSESEVTAASNPAKITSAKVSNGQVIVKATVSKATASSDDLYYLVKMNALSGKPVNALASLPKASSLTYKLDITDKANVISRFGLAVRKGKTFTLISNTRYVKNPEAAAGNTMAYTLPSTKKGIHGGDDLNLDIKHSLLTLNLNSLFTTKGKGEAYVYNGKTYYFTDKRQSNVKDFVSRGVRVTMVIYMPWNEKNKSLIYPSGREKGNYWYMLNTSAEKSREKLEAAFCYLGEKFGKPDCYVSNWVMGNEVNSQKYWNHAGNLSFSKYVKAYTQAFQMLSSGVRSGWANARVFVPIDNAWNIPVSIVGWTGKKFITSFAKTLKAECSSTPWNLAYHAYSFPLPSPPYKANEYVTKSANSYYITPQNLHYLTNYIAQTYGTDTRIILSEEGYMASTGETAQAASILYAYFIAEFNPMVDAFIMRCEYDDPAEVANGYAMGLSTADGVRRQAYRIFKYMDSPKATTYAKKYLKTIGAKSWKAIVPGFDAARFVY